MAQWDFWDLGEGYQSAWSEGCREMHRIPTRFADFLPGSATHLAHMPSSTCQQRGHRDINVDQNTDQPNPCTPSPVPSEHNDFPPFIPFETEPNEAGLYQIYPTRPSVPPNKNSLESVTNAPMLAGGDRVPDSSHITEGLSSKEIGQEDLYVAFSNPTSGLLMAYQYSGTGHQSVAELQQLTGFIGDLLFNNIDAASFSHTQESKNIDAYLEKKSNPFWEEFGWHQSAVKIRLPKEGKKWNTETEAPELKISGDDVATTYNMTPYREYWKSPDGHNIEIFSEAYSSPEMIETYKEINNLPHEAGDDLECIVASLMFWSDATHLANFGDASLWPFYLYFSNQSKYTRGKPTASTCHHIAYIPSLPKDLQDQYRAIFGEPCTSQVYTHCKLIHYGVQTLMLLRVILTGIKNLGQCLCLCCLTKKDEVPLMGSRLGTPVDGTRVKGILNDESLVPTRFVVDELHEFELGAWKALFTHLMCILHAAGGDAVQKLNERYCAMPTFGRGTIRKFNSNVLAMKRLAARDFEDLLQCTLPVFEGLLVLPDDDKDDTMVLYLLFDLATWHRFAKLRLHTEDTLKFSDTATAVLGQTVCKFAHTTCKRYHTTELPHEYATHGQREAALALALTDPKAKIVSSGPKFKKLNLKTYNFSTQPGELQHWRVKCWYPKTPKGKKNTVSSMTWIKTRERLIGKIVKARATLASREGDTGSQRRQRECTSPANHFHISKYAKSSINLTEWLSELPEDDLAVVRGQDFILKLKDHLLTRLRGIEYTGDELEFTDKERAQILIANNKIYEHSIIRIFHVDVWDRNDGAMEKPCRMEFLFVRWFGRDAKFQSGEDSNAFGFLDPDVIIRDSDWLCFYVNMFVDRDMFMRFRGGGVSHKVSCKWDAFLQSDGARMMNEEEEEDDDGDDDDDDDDDDDEEEEEEEEEEEDEDEDEDEDEEDEDGDDEEEDDENNDDEEDPDRVEADEGEELDDDFLAAEGYGAL
ncbi:hypothetical protein BDR05DRAFT_952336 [Suillus weaverae]|nr:hypothetical protein BDR05DRAFT_952336 [Suillus weaverae]